MAAVTTKHTAVSPGEFEHEIEKLDQGLLANLPPTVTLIVAGVPETRATLHATNQKYLDACKAVEAAKQAHLAAVGARNALTVGTRTYHKLVKAALKNYHGPEAQLLGSYGITPDRPIVQTTVQLVQAQAKGQQTRKVRGTRSRKQRQALKVVGDPAVTFHSDGTMEVGNRPVNLPATAPAPAAPSPAPEGSPQKPPSA
ncbi:MAG: hypothetical protein ACYDCL_00975 [Myxococcales bacterium]